ncbi:flippase-like domain-containing protein [Sinorhizobium numidicum]|uniref:Flippase-like domain-containing protein n=1 Tax=Sinorhizobium numidicum TaxID=680248 RepID=A0ABY8CRI3_9HYPH|nr:lysylphosphatidylglycerol synthase transmembrane domain-containing protein [Sinorhizobium numidicum]WEX75260.1 flippase-like domain-containing protein [Sinorhizobium numidicum]WEX81255.1 flippase-like domain-containing protein [Sinorhizobium numidicum]
MVDGDQLLRGRFNTTLRVGLGLIAGAAFVVLVLRDVNLAEVSDLLQRATLAPLFLAVLAFVADFLLRAVRFWIMLGQTTGRSLPLGPTIGPFIASFGMSDVLPLRLGDGFRVLWFSRRFGISAGTVLGTMIVERILDLVTIVILGAGALMLAEVSAPAALMRNFQLVLVVALAGGLGMLFVPALLSRLFERLFRGVELSIASSLLSALKATSAAVLQVGSWRRIAVLTVISLALWILESLVLIGAWLSLGGSPDHLLQPFVAFAFSTLGTLVPSLPGHFGAFEFFGVQAFALVGVDAQMAVAVVLLAHVILWAPTAIFGISWLLFGAYERVQRPT